MGAIAELPVPETGAIAALPVPQTETRTADEIDAANFRATSGGFARGLRSGVINIGTAANNLLGQAAEYGASVAGGGVSEGLTEFARTRFEQAKHMAEFADSVGPDTRDIQGVKDFATLTDYVGGQMGQAVGSTGPAIAAGIALRRPVAGVFGATLPQEAGGQVGTLRADPEVMARTTAGERLAGSLGVGGVNAVIETVGGPTRVVRNVLNPRMVKGVVKDVFKTGGEQGLQEGAQQVVQQQGHRVLNPERDASGDVMDVVNATVGGTVGGLGLGAGGHAATAIPRAVMAPSDAIANLFKREEGDPVDPEGMDYPDHLKTPEEVADYLDSTKERGMKFLNDTWERAKESPWAQQFKDWKEDPAIAGEFFKEAKQKALESKLGQQMGSWMKGIGEWTNRRKAKPQEGEKLSAMPTRMDDNILDKAMEYMPPEHEAVMTDEQKLQLIDMLKTAARTGEVPVELYHLYAKDVKATHKVLDGTAKLLGVEPAKMKSALAERQKSVQRTDDDVEELVRSHLQPKFRTKREVRDTALQHAIPYFQQYAHMGAESDTAGMSEGARAEKAFAEGQRPLAIARELFGDKADAFIERLDRLRDRTTSRPEEVLAEAKPTLEDLEEKQPAKEERENPEPPPEAPKYQSDARLMREYPSLEAADKMIEELRGEYGKRDAQFRVVDGGPGKYHIVAHDTTADESGFDDNAWSRLWNKASQKQRKAGLENGTLSVRRYTQREADGSPKRKPKLDEQGNPLLDENGKPVPGELASAIESQPISLHSLVNEMMERYGREREYADDTSRIGDMLFRGISQIMSDKSVAPKPFANAKVEGDHISFPDNMLVGRFDNKEYRWRDVKHAVLTKEGEGPGGDGTGTDQDVAGQMGRASTYGWVNVEKGAKGKAGERGKEKVKAPAGNQGPEWQTAGDNLAVDEQTRFEHARQFEQGKKKGQMEASQQVVKKTEGSPPSYDVVKGGKGESPTISGPSEDFAKRAKAGPTIREQDDIGRSGEKGERFVDEATREEIQPRARRAQTAEEKAKFGDRDAETPKAGKFSNLNIDKRTKLDAATEKAVRDYITKVLGHDGGRDLFAKMDAAGSFAGLSGAETLRISIWALDKQSVGYHEAAHALFARLAAHDVKSKALIENVASSPVMMGRLRELLAKYPKALAQLKDAEERAAYMYQFWEAGLLKFGPKATTFMEKVRAFFKNIVSILSGSEQGPRDFEKVERILQAFHNGAFADKNLVAAVAHDLNPATWWDRVNKTLGPIATGARRMTLSSEGLIRSMNQPELNKIMDLFHPALGSQGKEAGFMNKAEISTRFINRWTLATQGATEKDMAQATQLLRGETAINPSVMAKKIHKATRDLLDELKTYQADVRIKDKQGVWQEPGWRKDYYPQVYDQEYIDAHAAEFLDLLRKHGVPDPTQVLTKVLRDVDSTVPGEDDMNLGVSFFNKALNQRVIVNIPPDELAPFLSKNLPHTMLTYISQAVRRQEYAKRFGNDGQVIRDALDEAKKSGLTKEQEETFSTAVKAMEGTIRPDMDRDLRKIMGGIATYQNIRLLLMALFSNLPDAMGVWVRGGTVGDAAKTWVRGLKEVFHENRDGGYDMAAALGQISRSLDDMFMAQAQAGTQYIGPWKGINDWFFNMNGLEGLNRGNRIGATIAAEKFIIRHAEAPTAHSERYLAELNLTAKDVKVRNGHLDLSDPKIMNAMNRWVDGAIVRPNAAIRPPWFSDPMFMLISQLKQFTYGFQKVILARVAHEAVNGNLHPMMGMASMVPIIIAADMAKVALTPNAADDDFRKNWGILDWIWSGIQRIGTFGIGQTLLELKSGPNSAAYVAGPTTNQFMGMLQGDLQRNLLKAIPGANIVGVDLNPVPPE